MYTCTLPYTSDLSNFQFLSLFANTTLQWGLYRSRNFWCRPTEVRPSKFRVPWISTRRSSGNVEEWDATAVAFSRSVPLAFVSRFNAATALPGHLTPRAAVSLLTGWADNHWHFCDWSSLENLGRASVESEDKLPGTQLLATGKLTKKKPQVLPG